MSGYFYVFIIYLIVCEVLKCFSISENSLVKYALYCISLLLTFVVCSVIFNFLIELPESFDNGRIDQYGTEVLNSQSYNELVMDAFDEIVKEDICKASHLKFDISISPQRVELEYDDSDIENVKIRGIFIDLRETAHINDVYELQEYISDIYMCKCEVIV